MVIPPLGLSQQLLVSTTVESRGRVGEGDAEGGRECSGRAGIGAVSYVGNCEDSDHFQLGGGECSDGAEGNESWSESCDDSNEIIVNHVQIGKKNFSASTCFKNAKKASVGTCDIPNDEAAIKSSFNWAFQHGGFKQVYGKVDERQRSLISSFSTRFPLLSQSFKSWLPRSVSPVLHPTLRYTVRGMGVQFCFVQTSEHRQRFLNFCQQSSAVAIDTEGAPFNRNIDLVQIGDGDVVFLCPVRPQELEFLKEIAKTIFADEAKRVLQFGSDDVQKFLHALGIEFEIRCSMIDVQDRLRIQANLPKGKPPSLQSAVITRFGPCHVLSKAWTHSGWNNIPLHPEQEEYATLDVIFAFRLGFEMH